nr:ribonuclease H-like domain-containing protein [Tanacetum cinerariifolium]
MSVRTNMGLGFNDCIRENELGWDDSAFSVFTTNSEDVEGRPLFTRFAKADSIKDVPPPLSRDYTSLSYHIDLDESQMDSWATAVKPLAGCSWKLHRQDEGIFDSGCSRSMTSNKERLDDFQSFQGGKVTFGGEYKDETYPIFKDFINLVKNQLNKKVKAIRCDNGTEFKNAHMIDLCGSKRIKMEYSNAKTPQKNEVAERKNKTLIENSVLFTDTECLVLSKDFKLPDDSIVVLKVPRKHNLYTINLNNLCPRGNLACLVAHTSVDESVKWHRRMGNVNYKNMNIQWEMIRQVQKY